MVGNARYGDKRDRRHFADPPWDRETEEWLRIDERLPGDHLARRIDRAVELLDLESLYDGYAGLGQPAIRPDLLLKAMLYELEVGRQRPAEWHRDMQENDPVRWLTRGLEPSRSALDTFRDRCGEFLEEANRQVLQKALEVGVSRADRGALDGSTVAALATRRQYASEPVLNKRTVELDEALGADRSGMPLASRPGWMGATPLGRIRQRWRFRQVRELLDQRQRENEPRRASKRRPRDKVLVAWSDPEAAVGLDKFKVYRPLYHVQILQDLDSPLVRACDVLAQQNDAGTWLPLLDRAADILGHKPHTCLVDAGYLSAGDLAACALAGVTVYGPWQENDSRAEPSGSNQFTRIPKSQFGWEPDQHADRCPEGHPLHLSRTTIQQRGAGHEVLLELFTCASRHCLTCGRQESCTSNPRKGRTISRMQHEEFVEDLRLRMQTPAAKALYRLRRQTVELRFADFKEHRNLRRFSGRGLIRAENQLAANVLIHNLLTVAKHIDQNAAANPPTSLLQLAAA